MQNQIPQNSRKTPAKTVAHCKTESP
jgi:hypothetical protein